MRYSKLIPYDIANGPGVRTTLFVSGCNIHCTGCFNKSTWDFSSGEIFEESTYQKILKYVNDPGVNVAGISILGGEPLDNRNIIGVYDFITRFKKDAPGKTVWLFTGYTVEYLSGRYEGNVYLQKILKMIDVLKTGPYIDGLKDISLKFRGSSNQKIWDMNKTSEFGKLVEWKEV